MGIAYVILAHKNPEQIERLVSALSSASASFFIHIDQRAEQVYKAVEQTFSDSPNVHFVPCHKCWWGSFAIVQATISGLQTVLQSRVDFTHAVLLSGQDYPIKPVAQIEQFFQQNPQRQFLEYFALAAPNRWTEMGESYGARKRIADWHFMIRSHFFALPIKRRFPLGHVPYGGSQWWALSRQCVEYIIGFVEHNPGYLRFMSHSFIPDELFFQSIVMNSPWGITAINNDLRFIDWANPNPTPPATLLEADFERIAAAEALFARKFDSQRDTKILDLIDQKLLTGSDHHNLATQANQPDLVNVKPLVTLH